MNKTKIILAATGGAIGLAVLVMAFLVWRAYSARTVAREGDDEEGTPGLETVLEKARKLSRSDVYPCAASLAAVESNRTVLVEWQKEARRLAVRGDRVFEKTTPAAFKEFLVSDAKRLTTTEAPATNNVVRVKPDFAFGPFKDYISGGKMPAEAELVELQRRWDDVASIVEILAQSGIVELTDVGFAGAVDAGAAQAEGAKGPKPKAKGQKGKGKAKKSAAPRAAGLAPLSYSYVFSLTAKPAAFVRALNAFVVSERFITVESFTFGRPQDALVAKLGGEVKASGAAAAPTGRRRRRGGVAAAEPKDEEKDVKNGIVTDPLLDEPLAVVLTVNVRDFRSLEDEKAEEVAK